MNQQACTIFLAHENVDNWGWNKKNSIRIRWSGAWCSIQSITHVCYNIIMNLEPRRIGAHLRGTLLWLWNPAESSLTFAEVSAWSDLCMEVLPFTVAGGNHCHIKLALGFCMLCCFSGHLVCSLLSITSLFTCVLCSRAFLIYICHGYLCGIRLDHRVQLCQGECKLCKLCMLLHVLAVCSVMSLLPLCSRIMSVVATLCGIQWNLFIMDTLGLAIYGSFLLLYRGFPLSEVKM